MPDRPDPLIDTLTRFTPAAGLDRDELLYQAGRASASTARWWKLATVLLIAAQVVTLAVMLIPTSSRSIVLPPPQPPPHIPDLTPPPPPDPYYPHSYSALVRGWERDGSLPELSYGEPGPVRSPLTASAAWHGAALD